MKSMYSSFSSKKWLALLSAVSLAGAASTCLAVDAASRAANVKASPVTAPAVREVATQSATAPTDQELMRAVLAEVTHMPDPSLTRKVKIQAKNGKILLTGELKNEQQESEILTMVVRAVGADRIDNRLQVRSKKVVAKS